MKISTSPSYNLIILDASHLAYRNFYVHSKLKTSRGNFTGLIYGFLNCLRTYKQLYGTKDKHKVVAVWEGEKLKKQLLDKEYKGNRHKKDDNFLSQRSSLIKILKHAGINQYKAPGYEADDVIGYLSNYYSNKGYRILIITGDKDLCQLVNDKVHILSPKTAYRKIDLILDEEKIIEKYPFLKAPRQLAYYLALAGDKTDNVPRVGSFTEKVTISFLEKLLKDESDSDIIIEALITKSLSIEDNKRFHLNLQLVDIELSYEELSITDTIKMNKGIFNSKELAKDLEEYEINKLSVKDFLH